jgi:hypothetical protein
MFLSATVYPNIKILQCIHSLQALGLLQVFSVINKLLSVAVIYEAYAHYMLLWQFYTHLLWGLHKDI